jgi:hypothetical protein
VYCLCYWLPSFPCWSHFCNNGRQCSKSNFDRHALIMVTSGPYIAILTDGNYFFSLNLFQSESFRSFYPLKAQVYVFSLFSASKKFVFSCLPLCYWYLFSLFLVNINLKLLPWHQTLLHICLWSVYPLQMFEVYASLSCLISFRLFIKLEYLIG